jgi:hypothetical protein
MGQLRQHNSGSDDPLSTAIHGDLSARGPVEIRTGHGTDHRHDILCPNLDLIAV